MSSLQVLFELTHDAKCAKYEPEVTSGRWSVQAGNSIHTHGRNEVMLVWGSLRLTPIIHTEYDYCVFPAMDALLCAFCQWMTATAGYLTFRKCFVKTLKCQKNLLWELQTPIDGFQSIFSLWQLEGKGSCDVDIDQSAGSMVM